MRIHVNRDVTARFLEQKTIGMGQQQHRFFGVIDAAVREVRLIALDEGDAVDARNVACGDDRELIPRDLGRVLDAANHAAGGLASYRRAVQHPRHQQIVDVAGLAGDL